MTADRAFTTSPENEAALTLLVEGLRSLSVGGVLAYSTATGAIGEDVQGRARRLMARARTIVEREDGSRFGTVMGLGIKRLETVDVLGIGAGYRRHIRRTAATASKRLSGLRVNDLTPEQQRRLDAERAGFGAISLFTTEKAVKKIEAATTEATLPIDKTLELFARKAP